MSDHHVVCSTVLSTLSSSFSAYFKTYNQILEVGKGFGSYEHLKFRPSCWLKYRLLRHNYVTKVT